MNLAQLKNEKLLMFDIKGQVFIVGIIGNPKLNLLAESFTNANDQIAICFNDAQINRTFSELPEAAWDLIDIKDPTLILNLPVNKAQLPENWRQNTQFNLLSVEHKWLNYLPHNLPQALVGIIFNETELPKQLKPEDIVVNLHPKTASLPFKRVQLDKNGSIAITRK
jgi:hypothetical protein